MTVRASQSEAPAFAPGATLMLLILLAIVGIWLAATWALKEADMQGINTELAHVEQHS